MGAVVLSDGEHISLTGLAKWVLTLVKMARRR